MTEVLFSSLDLDDVSPLYRAHLFAMMSKPITGANIGALEMDLTRRQDFGEFLRAHTPTAEWFARDATTAGKVTNTRTRTRAVWALPGLF